MQLNENQDLYYQEQETNNNKKEILVIKSMKLKLCQKR